ncbi:hypothetical protein E4T42_09705 [Aureobasidium subglaciale]|nr:hypothetical protein E4T42_09705 [Aureobasidium subglaciale]
MFTASRIRHNLVRESLLQKLIDTKTNKPPSVPTKSGYQPGEKTARPRVLHIGCGTSDLSFRLKKLVDNADQIHNCDYSELVVTRQRQREAQLLSASNGDATRGKTQWSVLDLLDLKQVVEFKRREEDYDIVVDKSTTDAVACGEDVEVVLPYGINTTSSDQASPMEKALVYPPCVLAVHLANLATPGCYWVMLSYSAWRFEGWEQERLPGGLPTPGRLWALISHEKIIQPPDPQDTVHRPPETHHLYVLERTDVELKDW